MNTIVALGRIGRDAELRQAGQSNVSGFSMAVETTKKNGDNYVVDWMKVDVWGKLAEGLNQHLKKGAMVMVSGRLEMDTWTDGNGVVKTAPKINASNVKIVVWAKDANGQQAAPAQAQQQQKPATPPPVARQQQQADLDAIFASEDEIPF